MKWTVTRPGHHIATAPNGKVCRIDFIVGADSAFPGIVAPANRNYVASIDGVVIGTASHRLARDAKRACVKNLVSSKGFSFVGQSAVAIPPRH